MKKLHDKIKIEIVIEQIRADDAIEALEKAGAKGYTVLRKTSGKGNRGLREAGPLPDMFGNVLIISIVSLEVAERFVEDAEALLEDVAGILYLSDVRVLRSGHF